MQNIVSTNVFPSIKTLPIEERPRERLLSRGVSSLSSMELISIILSSGGSKNSLSEITRTLIDKYGDFKKLANTSVEELMSVNGLGLAKACQLVACFEIARRIDTNIAFRSKIYETIDELYALVKPFLLNREKEHFIVVALDSRRRLIGLENISIGTINQTIVHPREVFKVGISKSASYLMIAHNHPSGDHTPSADDITVTQRLVTASKTIGIPILDHIIVSDNGYTSLKKEEYMTDS